MRTTSLTLAVLLLASCRTLAAPPNPEEWADPNLKVTDGLELWLDAARQNVAGEPRNCPILPPARRSPHCMTAPASIVN